MKFNFRDKKSIRAALIFGGALILFVVIMIASDIKSKPSNVNPDDWTQANTESRAPSSSVPVSTAPLTQAPTETAPQPDTDSQPETTTPASESSDTDDNLEEASLAEKWAAAKEKTEVIYISGPEDDENASWIFYDPETSGILQNILSSIRDYYVRLDAPGVYRAVFSEDYVLDVPQERYTFTVTINDTSVIYVDYFYSNGNVRVYEG